MRILCVSAPDRFCAHELGMKVVAVDDMSGGFTSNIPTRVEFVKGDLQARTALFRCSRV
jgi:hypothetical protein